jgi:hypothetical protein
MAGLFEFIGSLKKRTVDNKNTTIGGGVVGIAFAALIGQIETASGCHFQEAFAGMDWVQVAGYVMIQAFGAMTTDGKKTV